MDELKVIPPRNVAEMLGVSVSWVYDHAEELGAVRIGGRKFFTESALKGVFERAVQNEKREVSRGNYDRRKADNKVLRYPGRGKKMGSRGKSQVELFGTDPGRHGIANIFQQISGSCRA